MGEYSSAHNLDDVFTAVSDSTRRAILARSTSGDARVTELATQFPISLNSTSKHIKILERAGLVRRTIQGRDHLLSLNAMPLGEAATWLQDYERFWQDRLAALDAFVTNKRKRLHQGRKK